MPNMKDIISLFVMMKYEQIAKNFSTNWYVDNYKTCIPTSIWKMEVGSRNFLAMSIRRLQVSLK